MLRYRPPGGLGEGMQKSVSLRRSSWAARSIRALVGSSTRNPKRSSVNRTNFSSCRVRWLDRPVKNRSRRDFRPAQVAARHSCGRPQRRW
jgi:hypothetical protein